MDFIYNGTRTGRYLIRALAGRSRRDSGSQGLTGCMSHNSQLVPLLVMIVSRYVFNARSFWPR